MDLSELVHSSVFLAVALPLLIFVARVSDVTLGTLRMVFVARGEKGRAALMGFFEVLIWLSVISYILQNLTSVWNYLAYAAGFAAGNYLGLKIEEKMALGLLGVTVITHRDARELIDRLRQEQYGITSVSATGATGRVRIVFSVIRRKHLEDLRQIVERFHPNAFIAIQNVRSVSKQVYPYQDLGRRPTDFLLWWRKGK
jgi:uncharacterized protein YebE (UPF0316 family)